MMTKNELIGFLMECEILWIGQDLTLVFKENIAGDGPQGVWQVISYEKRRREVVGQFPDIEDAIAFMSHYNDDVVTSLTTTGEAGTI